MNSQEYKANIGKDKALVFKPDPDREEDMQFAKEFKEAAALKPGSLQDFFIRLVEIQEKNTHKNSPAMQIELKNIKVAHHMSEETTAFTANLYVNNKKIAFVKNEGTGGNTNYQLYNIEDRPLLQQAEEYCKTLPPDVVPSGVSPGETFTLPMNIEHYIDNLLDAHLQKKDQEKFTRNMEDSILFGVAGSHYHQLKFSKPIAEMLQFAKGIEAIKTVIQEKVLPKIKEGETILNTNLPPEMMNLERKQVRKPRITGDDTSSKKSSRRR